MREHEVCLRSYRTPFFTRLRLRLHVCAQTPLLPLGHRANTSASATSPACPRTIACQKWRVRNRRSSSVTEEFANDSGIAGLPLVGSAPLLPSSMTSVKWLWDRLFSPLLLQVHGHAHCCADGVWRTKIEMRRLAVVVADPAAQRCRAALTWLVAAIA